MNFFDEEDEFENLDKKLFEENYKKQIKLSKKIFKILGLVFLSISLVLIVIAFILEEEIVAIPALPFFIVGIVFIILGLTLPEKVNYEKIKDRQKKYGFVDTSEMSAKIITLDEKCRILESRIKDLEDEVRRLK